MSYQEFLSALNSYSFDYKAVYTVYKHEDLHVYIVNEGTMTLSVKYKESYYKDDSTSPSKSTILSAFRATRGIIQDILNLGFSVQCDIFSKDHYTDRRKDWAALLGMESIYKDSNKWKISPPPLVEEEEEEEFDYSDYD